MDMRRLTLLASIFVTGAGAFIAGATEVFFSATINQSPFAIPGYTVGSTVVGSFQYSALTVPNATGANYTEYRLSSMTHSFGSANYNAGSTRLTMAHNIGVEIGPTVFNDVDFYSVTGFTLTGPMVSGLQPLFCSLHLIDINASVYAGVPPPYSVAFPDSNQFESKLFSVTFSQSAVIRCTIDSIAVVPEPSALSLFLTGGLLAILYQHRVIQKRASACG